MRKGENAAKWDQQAKKGGPKCFEQLMSEYKDVAYSYKAQVMKALADVKDVYDYDFVAAAQEDKTNEVQTPGGSRKLAIDEFNKRVNSAPLARGAMLARGSTIGANSRSFWQIERLLTIVDHVQAIVDVINDDQAAVRELPSSSLFPPPLFDTE